MLPCQGIATATANSQLFGFPAANRYGYPARSSVSSKQAFLKLRAPALRCDKKIPPLRGIDFLAYEHFTQAQRCDCTLEFLSAHEGVFISTT